MNISMTTQRPARLWARAWLAGAVLALGAAAPALAAGTLDKIKDSARITLGYVADMRPFAYADAGGKPAGYAIALCNKVADALKAQLPAPALAVEYVRVTRSEGLAALEQGKVDLVCGAVPTLERRAAVDFSIPIMVSGTGVALRADAPLRVLEVLSGREPQNRPVWRGSTDQAPQHAVLAVVGGMTLEKTLAERLKERRIVAEIVQVADTDAGLQLLAARGADALFNDRSLLLDGVARSKTPSDFVVPERTFRRDLVALGLRRGDDAFRLAVDRALSRVYRSEDMAALYSTYFGKAPGPAPDFFQLMALPD